MPCFDSSLSSSSPASGTTRARFFSSWRTEGPLRAQVVSAIRSKAAYAERSGMRRTADHPAPKPHAVS